MFIFVFILRAKHVPGKLNGAADLISSNDMFHFYSQLPTAKPHAMPIPQQLWSLVVMEHPDWLSCLLVVLLVFNY